MDCPQCHGANAPNVEVCFSCGRPLGFQGLRQGALIAARYELLEALGSGGMGMVFKAHDRSLDETVAIKVLRPEVASQEEMARRLQSEIKLARKVRHANVCAIHEYGEDGELRFITMEFIEGEDLHKLLGREGALPAERAYDMAMQLAEGLQAIHAAGIVHRDLKTPNIMLDAHGLAHLMDFGIAKRVDQHGTTSAGTVTGTPEYMSPEQARGEAVDFRTDIYGLGVVVFELFAGRVPFRGETPVATIFKHLQEAPPLTGAGAPRLPPALVPVLAKALAKQPFQRFQNTAELIEALKRAKSGALPAAAPNGQDTGAFWSCPNCKRHVPARVIVCRCGDPRPAPPAASAPQPGAAPAPSAPRNSAVVALGGLLALVLVAGTLWALRLFTRPATTTTAAASPSPADASLPAGGPHPHASAAPAADGNSLDNVVPGLVPLPSPSSLPSASAAPQAGPTPLAAPSASEPPPAEATDDPRVSSDIDRLRETGTRNFDESLATLSQRVAEWRATVARCYGASALPAEAPTATLAPMTVGSCSTTRRELLSVGGALLEASARAEEDARRAWVPPGTQRSIRQKHGLDHEAVERLKTDLGALQRE